MLCRVIDGVYVHKYMIITIEDRFTYYLWIHVTMQQKGLKYDRFKGLFSTKRTKHGRKLDNYGAIGQVVEEMRLVCSRKEVKSN